MGDLTKNISRHELKCKCGKCDVTILDYEPVIKIVQDVCDHFANEYEIEKVMLVITSAARCYEYNREIGSTDNSRHPRANAMDIKVFATGLQVPTQDVFDYLNYKYPDKLGLGLYDTFTHVDTRNIRARW